MTALIVVVGVLVLMVGWPCLTVGEQARQLRDLHAACTDSAEKLGERIETLQSELGLHAKAINKQHSRICYLEREYLVSVGVAPAARDPEETQDMPVLERARVAREGAVMADTLPYEFDEGEEEGE